MRFLLITLLLTTTNWLYAEVTHCSYGELERSVEVIYSDPGQPTPCEVLYSKPSEGGNSTPWRAESEAGYCESKAIELVARLVGYGWQCAATLPEAEVEVEAETETETEAESEPAEPSS